MERPSHRHSRTNQSPFSPEQQLRATAEKHVRRLLLLLEDSSANVVGDRIVPKPHFQYNCVNLNWTTNQLSFHYAAHA